MKGESIIEPVLYFLMFLFIMAFFLVIDGIYGDALHLLMCEGVECLL
jgi:hypothetical protein